MKECGCGLGMRLWNKLANFLRASKHVFVYMAGLNSFRGVDLVKKFSALSTNLTLSAAHIVTPTLSINVPTSMVWPPAGKQKECKWYS